MAINYMKLAGEIQNPINFPDDILQRMVRSPNPAMPMEQSLAMGEWMRRQKARQGAAQPAQTDTRTVKDLVLDAAQQKNVMENNPGIQQYPQPQMDTRGTVPQVGKSFAGGGLVAFGPGGVVGDQLRSMQGGIPQFLPTSGAEAAQSAPGITYNEWLKGAGQGLDLLSTDDPNIDGFFPWLGKTLAGRGDRPLIDLKSNTAVPNGAVPFKYTGPASYLEMQGKKMPPAVIDPASPVAAVTESPIVSAPSTPPTARSGISATRPDLDAFAKDLIGNKPKGQTINEAYDEQAKLWEKVLGSEGYSKEKEALEGEREEGKKAHEQNKAHAMLAAAGSMMAQENPLERSAGLGGFLQGLGRAAKTATPILMEGDKEYKRLMSEANKIGLQIKSSERLEAMGKVKEAQVQADKAQDRLEKWEEKRAGILGQLKVAQLHGESAEKVAGIHAAAANRNPQDDIIKQYAKSADIPYYQAVDRVRGLDIKSDIADSKGFKDWLDSNSKASPGMFVGKTPQQIKTMYLQSIGAKSGIATIDASGMFPPKQ